MVLDPANNLAATELTASVSDTATTLPVADASVFPDAATEGAFNLLVWDAETSVDPVGEPDAEFVRVTSVDTTADELTVQRGQEDTAAAAHPSGARVADTWSAKDRTDIVDGVAAKADDPHAHTGTDDGGAPLGRVPGQSKFKQTLEDEGVSKVHNGVVYAGHPDFSTLQAAIDFAGANEYTGVLLEAGVTYSESITLADTFEDSSIRLFGPGGGAGGSINMPTIDGDVTLESQSIHLEGVVVKGNLNIESGARQSSIRHCQVQNELKINAVSSGDGYKILGVDRSTIRVTTNGVNASIIGCTDCDIILDGDDSVVIGCVNSAVTDNGLNNQVGFNT